MQVKYQVVIEGVGKNVPNADGTISDFARVFKLSEEKAKQLLAKKRILKKGLDKHQAEILSRRLNAIGVSAKVVPEKQAEEIKENPKAIPKKNSQQNNVPLELVPTSVIDENAEDKNKQSQNLSADNDATSLELNNENDQDHDATFSSGNIRVQAKMKSSILSIEIIEGVTVVGLIISCIVAGVGAVLWSEAAISNENEFNWLAVAVGAAIGIAVLVSGGSSVVSGFFAMGLAIGAIIVARQLIFVGMLNVVAHSSDNELSKLLERRQTLLQDYDYNMSDNEFVAFYQNFTNGPTDKKYRGETRGTNSQIIEARPFFESRIPAILNLTYEDLLPGIEEARHVASQAVKGLKPDFFGVEFLMYLTFGSIIAFRFGMGFGR